MRGQSKADAEPFSIRGEAAWFLEAGGADIGWADGRQLTVAGNVELERITLLLGQLSLTQALRF